MACCITLIKHVSPFYPKGSKNNHKSWKREYVNTKGCPCIIGTCIRSDWSSSYVYIYIYPWKAKVGVSI